MKNELVWLAGQSPGIEIVEDKRQRVLGQQHSEGPMGVDRK